MGSLPTISLFLKINVSVVEREYTSCERVDLVLLPLNETTRTYMTTTVLSPSDALYYPAPATFVLKDFKHIRTSVFQEVCASVQNTFA